MVSLDSRCKVVVRRLPPSLQEEAFRESLKEWVDRTDWFSYVQGKASTKELLHSRAYLRFKDAADVPRFQQAWDGHAFVNERGTQFRCQVQYAANQRVPRHRVKRDPKEGTIEKDADFLAFVERLEAGPQAAEPAAAAADGGATNALIVTPLMQYLKDKRQPKGALAQARRAAKTAAVLVKGKAGAGAADKKSKAAATAAAGKKGPPKQVVMVGKKGDAKQPAAATATAAAADAAPGSKPARKAVLVPSKKPPAAASSALPPGILKRSAVEAADAAPPSPPQPLPAKAKQAGKQAQGKIDKQQRDEAQLAAAQQAAQHEQQQDQEQQQGGTKVPSRPRLQQAVGQEAAPAAQGGAAGSSAAGSAGEEAPKQRASKPERVRGGFGAYQPKVVGRLLQQALPQLAEGGSVDGSSSGGRGGGGGGGGRGRGRGRQRHAGGAAEAAGKQ